MKSSRSSSGRASGRVTLADVAARAGVATMTASRAIHAPDKVSEALRLRVQAAVAELNYVPNRAARMLASERSGVIAVLVPSLANAVFTAVLDGIQDALREQDYQILIGNTHYRDEEEEKLLAAWLQSQPDGVLLCGLQHSERVQALLRDSATPWVAMMDVGSRPDQLSVGFSQFEAGQAMARYLLDKGYRAPGFIGAQLDERTLRRAEGWRSVVQQAGCYDARRELLVAEPSTIALGAELLGRLLAVAPECDAVFCCNDDLAQGAVYQCQRRGIRVPGQLAIAGFNDLPASAWMNPSLTTIGTPRYRIGFEAARLLQAAIRGEPISTPCLDLGFTVMARESA